MAFKVGDYVRLNTPDPSNSWGTSGAIVRITDPHDNGRSYQYGRLQHEYVFTSGTKVPSGYQVAVTLTGKWSLIARKERGELLMKEANELQRRSDEVRGQAAALLRYDSDEEELAATLVDILDADGPRESRIKQIMDILSNRDKSSML